MSSNNPEPWEIVFLQWGLPLSPYSNSIFDIKRWEKRFIDNGFLPSVKARNTFIVFSQWNDLYQRIISLEEDNIITRLDKYLTTNIFSSLYNGGEFYNFLLSLKDHLYDICKYGEEFNRFMLINFSRLHSILEKDYIINTSRIMKNTPKVLEKWNHLRSKIEFLVSDRIGNYIDPRAMVYISRNISFDVANLFFILPFRFQAIFDYSIYFQSLLCENLSRVYKIIKD